MNRSIPLLNISLSYLAGLIFASNINPDSDLLTIAASTSVIATTIIFFLFHCICTKNTTKADDKIFYAAIMISIFLLAQLNLNFSGYYYKITKISSIPPGKMKYAQLVVDKVIKISKNSVTINSKSLDFKENVRLTIKDSIKTVEKGDTILGTVYFYPIVKTQGNRNIIKYMAMNHIYSNGYVYPNNYSIKQPPQKPSVKWIESMNAKFAENLKSKISNEGNFSVIIALTTGFKGEMEKETARAFSKSGSMHLMAVSGLHVAYIHLFLTYILYIFGNTKWIKFGRGIVILTSIWFYAAFTGMTASIVRASIMLSCLEISKITCRCNKSLNTLSFAFLVICIVNPETFFNAGFRLSFIATLSIIVLQPRLYRIYNFKSKILQYIWNNSTISICCQLGTLPLTISYFGYIPIYFLISNLAAIPISAMIIVFTAIVAVLSPGLLCDMAVVILDFLCNTLLWLVRTIELLPFATIEFK